MRAALCGSQAGTFFDFLARVTSDAAKAGIILNVARVTRSKSTPVRYLAGVLDVEARAGIGNVGQHAAVQFAGREADPGGAADLAAAEFALVSDHGRVAMPLRERAPARPGARL